MTQAYESGVELCETLRDGACLWDGVSEVSIYTEHLEDSYPDWHPAPDLFQGMVRLFIYREITGDSYRTLETYQELAEPFGLEHIPDESVLSRTWRKRFDDGVREYVTVAAHFVVEEIHDYGPTVPAMRPKEEVTDSTPESGDDNEQDESGGGEFSDEQIRRTTRLARNHGFDGFDSGRAQNASYEDVQFFELQTFMGMVGCGTAQGAARFQFRQGEEYGPHGDTHLRAIKQFEPEALIEGFDEASDRELAKAHGEDIEEEEPNPIAGVQCPRCREKTPRSEPFCMWCNQAIEHGAVDEIQEDQDQQRRNLLRIAQENPDLLETLEDFEPVIEALGGDAELIQAAQQFNEAVND